MERRLAAVLATDMVGYSRLMEADEAGTLARQKACRYDVVDPEIQRCRGRIVKTTGGNGTLSIGALVSGDIPNNAADTSGTAAVATTVTVTDNESTDESAWLSTT